MKFLLFILLFFINANGYAQYDSLRFKMLENGILHRLDINGIYFTHEGKIWFGTGDGLASFDGNDFRVYPVNTKKEEDITPERVLAFAEDKDGFIWTFSPNHILSKFNPKTSIYEKVNFLKEFKIPENKFGIYILHFDKQNKLWIGTTDYGFFIYDPDTGKSEQYNLDASKHGVWESHYGNSVRYFLEDPDNSNTIWLASYGDGIFSFNKQTKTISKNFRAVSVTDSVWRNCYITWMDIKDKTIWFGTWGTGMGEYDTQTGEYKMYPKNSGFYTEHVGKEIFTHGHIVTQMIKKSDSEFIVALADSLPAIFNTTTKMFNYLRDAQLMRTIDRVFNIGIDKQNNNTWFLKGGKLYIASPKYNLFHTLNFNSTNPSRYYSDIRDVIWNNRDKSYYAGANYSEGVHVFDENLREKNIITMPLYNGKGIVNASSAWRVRFDKTDRLWAMGYIFCVYDSLTKQMIPVDKKFPAIKEFKNEFIDFTSDANGNLILLNNNRELVFLDAITFAAHTVSLPQINFEKKFDFYPHNILIDTPRNIIYVCDGQAIFQYSINTKSFKTIEYNPAVANSLPAGNVSGYDLDFDGNLWIGTRGIFIYEPLQLKLIKQITAKDNLTDNINIHLFRGPQGCMFFFTSKGGNLYSLHDSVFVHFDMNNGMASDNSSACFANNHLFLSIGLYTKLNQYTDVTSLLSLQKQIIPYVSDIRIMNKRIGRDTIPEFLSQLQLPHNQNSITLTFSSVEFAFPERVEYGYKLEGIENDWTVTDYMNRSVTYTNLSPGKYVFKVRARMLGGKWEEQILPLNISIIPAFWQTVLFKILCALAIGAFIYYLVRQRISAIRKKEKMKTVHEKELIELEAKALRAQMNPHFIFNCLNSIKALIQKNENDTAANYLTTFSKLIRTLFQYSDKREVSLYEEIETCKLYTQLEALRFTNKVSFNFDVDKRIDLKDIKVPALILQPFIENAIWHGLVPKEAGGKVTIRVYQTEDGIKCIVDDDGIGRELSRQYKGQYNSTHESKGISLAKSRLNIDRILNEREEEIEIFDKKDRDGNAAGTTAILTFKN